jgi:hypothetical protein
MSTLAVKFNENQGRIFIRGELIDSMDIAGVVETLLLEELEVSDELEEVVEELEEVVDELEELEEVVVELLLAA